MVEATGGNVLTFPYIAGLQPYRYIKAKTKTEAVGLALQRLYQEMGEFYRVELKLAETVDKPTKWEPEVIQANAKQNRHVEVHFPQRLMPCAKASP